MHGRIHGIYGANPSHALAAPYNQDPFFGYSAWRYAPSAYGPAWELVAGLAARVAGNRMWRTSCVQAPTGHLPRWYGCVVASLLRQAAPQRALGRTWLIAMARRPV